MRYQVFGLHRRHGVQGANNLKRRIAQRLNRQDGVFSVQLSVLTGTVMVRCRPECSVENFRGLLEEAVKDHLGGIRYDPDSGEVDLEPVPETTAQGSAMALKGEMRPGSQLGRPQEEPWHQRSANDVTAFFSSDTKRGLSHEEAEKTLALAGPNLLPRAQPRSDWEILRGQFSSLPVVLLGGSAALSVLTGGFSDALVILSVVGINAAIGYLTESRAERTINSLERLVHPGAVIQREGEIRQIESAQVVPGDILVLRPGTYISADCRVIESHHLTVDESALTGESLPVSKRSAELDEEDLPLADQVNMVFMGTLVTGGQGLAVVVATGRYTEIGQVQAMVGEAGTPETPMERELDRVGTQLVLVSGGVCALVFVIGLLRGYGVLPMLKNAISLAVAAIPEGLPTVATTMLAMGIGKMKRHQVLIRRLDAVESLGCVQTVCLDKTGTLTLNKMSVRQVQCAGETIRVEKGQLTIGEHPLDAKQRLELYLLLMVASLCSETEINGGVEEHELEGSATENAMIELALAGGIDVRSLRRNFPLLRMTHRTETRKHMSTIHEIGEVEDLPVADFLQGDGRRRLVAVKGSPAEVLDLCRWQMVDGERTPLSEDDRHRVELENERMAGEALRVLGVACAILDHEHGGAGSKEELTWLGLVGMADPLRKGLTELMARFHRAGIATIMITGDQVPTAYAIGRELHLQADGNLEIFESTRMKDMDPQMLAGAVRNVHIFARVSPAQKLQIVQALQRGGRIVAMTGDGINDGPALKAADIGVSMGTVGTEVAREVADVVLEDDNLETLIIAVEEGRNTYSNIRKSIRFLLSTNMSEIMVVCTGLTLGLGQTMTPMQLLWINLISDIFPGLALALEAPEPDVLERPPRDPEQPIISSRDLRRTSFEASMLAGSSLAAYGYGVARYGAGARAGTLGFMTLTVGQLLHTLSCRSERPVVFGGQRLPPNNYLRAAVGGSIGLQLLAVLIPGLRNFLGLSSLGLVDAAVIGGGSLLPLVINEASKETGRKEGTSS